MGSIKLIYSTFKPCSIGHLVNDDYNIMRYWNIFGTNTQSGILRLKQLMDFIRTSMFSHGVHRGSYHLGAKYLWVASPTVPPPLKNSSNQISYLKWMYEFLHATFEIDFFVEIKQFKIPKLSDIIFGNRHFANTKKVITSNSRDNG